MVEPLRTWPFLLGDPHAHQASCPESGGRHANQPQSRPHPARRLVAAPAGSVSFETTTGVPASVDALAPSPDHHRDQGKARPDNADARRLATVAA